MFPSLSNGYSDINKTLYYASKPKELNISLLRMFLIVDLNLLLKTKKIALEIY